VLVGWQQLLIASRSRHLAICYHFLLDAAHFWALSLLIQKDYEKARVPMLPVLMGEGETRRQIFLYSLLLVAVTLILFVMRVMGYFYLVFALALEVS